MECPSSSIAANCRPKQHNPLPLPPEDRRLLAPSTSGARFLCPWSLTFCRHPRLPSARVPRVRSRQLAQRMTQMKLVASTRDGTFSTVPWASTVSLRVSQNIGGKCCRQADIYNNITKKELLSSQKCFAWIFFYRGKYSCWNIGDGSLIQYAEKHSQIHWTEEERSNVRRNVLLKNLLPKDNCINNKTPPL